MLSPRWLKVLRDVWGNRSRTLLVVLSISAGVLPRPARMASVCSPRRGGCMRYSTGEPA